MNVVTFFLILATVNTYSEIIQDPINDFLRLPIEGFYSDASELVNIHAVYCDLDGDGIEECFVGHHQMWYGGHAIYFSAYEKKNNRFQRLLPFSQAAPIDFYDGEKECVFIGAVVERSSQGMLIGDPVYKHVSGDPGELLPVVEYSSLKFYRIQDGRLIVDELGPLDLRTPEGKAFFDRYFGKDVKSRAIRFESYSVKKLKELGYTIPDWKQAPESSSTQAELQANASQLTAQTTPIPAMATPDQQPKSATSPSPVVQAELSKSLPWPWMIGAFLLLAVVGGILFKYLRRQICRQ
jgi:hypothetical protein